MSTAGIPTIHNLNSCVVLACQRSSGVGIPAGNQARNWRIPFAIRSNETQGGKEVKPSGSGRSKSRLGRLVLRMTEDSDEGFIEFGCSMLHKQGLVMRIAKIDFMPPEQYFHIVRILGSAMQQVLSKCVEL